LVRKYCDFIPVPIKLNGEVINKQKPLWRTSPSELKDEDYLEFYRYLYPFQEDPHFWVHINTDYPFIVQGILYFPKLRPDIDPTKGQVKLFCNQVFVQDNCEEVIPSSSYLCGGPSTVRIFPSTSLAASCKMTAP
jgi:molecular chaperone HtpG